MATLELICKVGVTAKYKPDKLLITVCYHLCIASHVLRVALYGTFIIRT